MTTSRIVASTGLVLLLALMVYAAISGTGGTTADDAMQVSSSTPASTVVAEQEAEAEVDDGEAEAGSDDDSEIGADQNSETAAALADAPPILGQARVIDGLDGWLQTDVTSFDEIDAPVRVVQFWTFGCFNCKNTLDNLADLYAIYQDQGLEIVGVHAPEFDYEKDPEAIAAAAVDLNVTWPIALDTNKKNFRAWQDGRRFWPRTFVLDADDNIRFDRIGEGAYDELNATVAWLIANQA